MILSRTIILLYSLLFAACTAAHAPPAEEQALREQKIRELLKSGTRLLRAGAWDDLDRAQAAFTLARSLRFDDPRAIDGLGCVAWRKGNAELAELYFQRALEIEPAYDRSLAHLALVAESRGHLRAANELLQRAVIMNPLNFHSRNNYAALIMKTDRDKSSLAEAHRQLLQAYQLAGSEDPIVDGNLNLLKQTSGW